MQAAIIAGVAALLGVVSGALLTYLIARGQHRIALNSLLADKWWDRKERAYSETVGSLMSLAYSLERRLYLHVQHVDSEEALRPLQEERTRATRKVNRAAIRGSYAVSGRTAAALSGLIEQLENPPPDGMRASLSSLMSGWRLQASVSESCALKLSRVCGLVWNEGCPNLVRAGGMSKQKIGWEVWLELVVTTPVAVAGLSGVAGHYGGRTVVDGGRDSEGE